MATAPRSALIRRAAEKHEIHRDTLSRAIRHGVGTIRGRAAQRRCRAALATLVLELERQRHDDGKVIETLAEIMADAAAEARS